MGEDAGSAAIRGDRENGDDVGVANLFSKRNRGVAANEREQRQSTRIHGEFGRRIEWNEICDAMEERWGDQVLN
jgi:hypothetical protein